MRFIVHCRSANYIRKIAGSYSGMYLSVSKLKVTKQDRLFVLSDPFLPSLFILPSCII